MRLGTIFSASDKALFDALNQKNVTNPDLRELFLSRGILVSKESSRKQLALHFSRLQHDFADYQKLAKLFGNPQFRDKLASARIATKVPIATFESAALTLKSELEESGAVVRVSSAKGTRLDIEVKYSKVHFNKSEFRQVVSRTAVISLVRSGDDVVVHTPRSDESREWVETLAKYAGEKSGEDLEISEITLPLGLDPKAKSAFFRRLIEELAGYSLLDVTDVYVSKPKGSTEEEEDGDDDSHSGVHISKASLRGEGVMQSDELELLSAKGFYISKIVWIAKRASLDSDVYEFEAQFADPDNCRDFSYLPRGYYKFLTNGNHSQSRTSFTTEEEQRLGQIIEAAARATLLKLPGVGHA